MKLARLIKTTLATHCVLAVLAWPAAAAAQGVMQRIAKRDQINLGYRDDAPPFSFHDSKGQPMGYSIDICRAMAERVRLALDKPGLRIKYIPVAADQMARVVSSGGVDLMCAGTSDTPERRRSMAFSPPVFVSAVKFMVRSKDKLGTARQLQGQTVAVLGRTTAEGAVANFSASAGVPLKIARVVSPQAALSQLKLGQAAAFARDEVLLLNQRAQQPQPAEFALLPEALSTELMAIALPRGDAQLQKAVDQALALLVRGGQADALYTRWFMQPHAGAKAGLMLPMSAELKAEFGRLR